MRFLFTHYIEGSDNVVSKYIDNTINNLMCCGNYGPHENKILIFFVSLLNHDILLFFIKNNLLFKYFQK